MCLEQTRKSMVGVKRYTLFLQSLSGFVCGNGCSSAVHRPDTAGCCRTKGGDRDSDQLSALAHDVSLLGALSCHISTLPSPATATVISMFIVLSRTAQMCGA
jgi:hypothetical protein